MLSRPRCVLILAALALPALAHASTWEIDPAHNAHFAVKHLVTLDGARHLSRVTGTVTLDESDPTKSSAQATIDAAGVDTAATIKRDERRAPTSSTSPSIRPSLSRRRSRRSRTITTR
jgi:polyisoprenoid-binding protein YceI